MLSEKGGNFLNLLQKVKGTQKGGGGGVPSEKGVPTLRKPCKLCLKSPICL